MVGSVAAAHPRPEQPLPPVLPLPRRGPAKAPHPAMVQVLDLGGIPGQRRVGDIRPGHSLQPPQEAGGGHRAARGAVGSHPLAPPGRAGWHDRLQHRGQRAMAKALSSDGSISGTTFNSCLMNNPLPGSCCYLKLRIRCIYGPFTRVYHSRFRSL
jgi:hypothetical protein